MTGDLIRASVRTSTDAYLYLAFCTDQQLQTYPSQRGIRTTAGDLVFLPEGGGDLVLDNHTGPEVLYLIVSRDELSSADPHLAALIATTGDAIKAVDCGASLDIRLMSSTGIVPPGNPLRGEVITKRIPQPGTASEGLDLAGNPGDAVWYAVDRGNNPGTVVAADSDGIAIVRYRLIHVASTHVDDHMRRN